VREPSPIVVSRAPLTVEKVVSVDTPWLSIPVREPSTIESRAPLAVEKVVSADTPWRLKKQRKDTPAVTLPSADISWRQNQNQGAPKAPPRSKKSASPVNKRGQLARLPSDTEEVKSEASNLIASCEQYLDENPVTIINPFLGLQKMDESADILGSNTSLAAQRRKLSSVSDIRDSIKETHEDAGNLSYGVGCQTVPRAFSPRSVSVSPMVSRARTQPLLPAVSLASAVSEARGIAARRSKSVAVANRRPSKQGLYKRQDGTESVRSFVIVSNNSTLDLNSDTEESNSFGAAAVGGDNSDEESWSDNDDSYNKSSSDFQNNSKNPRNKGFVNKCVSRVKSLVNPAKN